jgi:large subunit ribosomal protein L32
MRRCFGAVVFRGIIVPNPKRRHSKSRKNKRRAHDALGTVALTDCPRCGQRTLPHAVCDNCGHYKGLAVIEKEGA